MKTRVQVGDAVLVRDWRTDQPPWAKESLSGVARHRGRNRHGLYIRVEFGDGSIEDVHPTLCRRVADAGWPK